jgi:arginase
MTRQKISIIGVPMDLGASRRGVDMGPNAVRIAYLQEKLEKLGYPVEDRGNLTVHGRESLEEGSSSAKYAKAIAQALRGLAKETYETIKGGSIPLILGGDHSLSIGSVAGIAQYFREKNQKLGMIWFDAHADINTPETSPSGNVHGMPVAHLLGLGDPDLLKVSDVQPALDVTKVVQIGLRDLDEGERTTLKKLGVKAFTMRDIDERGMRAVVQEAIEIASRDTAGIHVSWDMDWIDPSYAPGVGTPVRGGGSYRESHLAMEMIADTKKMVSVEVTEINPVLDRENKTAELAVEILLSAFGLRIL